MFLQKRPWHLFVGWFLCLLLPVTIFTQTQISRCSTKSSSETWLTWLCSLCPVLHKRLLYPLCKYDTHYLPPALICDSQTAALRENLHTLKDQQQQHGNRLQQDMMCHVVSNHTVICVTPLMLLPHFQGLFNEWKSMTKSLTLSRVFPENTTQKYHKWSQKHENKPRAAKL